MLRKRLAAVIVGAGALLALVPFGASHVWAHREHRPSGESAPAVVQRYFTALNAGMKSGDFAAMRSIYAPNAVLTQSTPLGQTRVNRGLPQILAFYTAMHANYPRLHWTQDWSRSLSDTVVMNYEFASNATYRVPGRCAHIFVVKNGRIQTLDWVVFYFGQK